MKKKKTCKYFKKNKDVDAMKLAKDGLVLTGGLVVLGAAAKMLK